MQDIAPRTGSLFHLGLTRSTPAYLLIGANIDVFIATIMTVLGGNDDIQCLAATSRNNQTLDRTTSLLLCQLDPIPHRISIGTTVHPQGDPSGGDIWGSSCDVSGPSLLQRVYFYTLYNHQIIATLVSLHTHSSASLYRPQCLFSHYGASDICRALRAQVVLVPVHHRYHGISTLRIRS